MSDVKLFCGNANPVLAASIAQHMGMVLGRAEVGKFSDGETMVEILENVRGKEVFILQSLCAPTNDSLMELLIMADALRRASVASITAVMPYYGYARQDRRVRSARVPITAKLVADMLVSSGISRMITVDLHAEQIQGFFCIPVDNVYATPVILDDIRGQSFDRIQVVSPDVGGVMRARAVAKRLDADLAVIDKRRSIRNQVEVMNLIGDVEGQDCILVDDMVDTAGTLCQAAQVLKDRGARQVVAYCTHPVLSGEAIERIGNSCLKELVVADSIPLSTNAEKCDRIRQLSLGKMLAETIMRVSSRESVSSMFVEE